MPVRPPPPCRLIDCGVSQSSRLSHARLSQKHEKLPLHWEAQTLAFHLLDRSTCELVDVVFSTDGRSLETGETGGRGVHGRNFSGASVTVELLHKHAALRGKRSF